MMMMTMTIMAMVVYRKSLEFFRISVGNYE
jgi:hypothetical protein